MESPPERYAYVAALAPDNKSRSDALLVVDLDASSGSYGNAPERCASCPNQSSGENVVPKLFALYKYPFQRHLHLCGVEDR
jgi:hypothetical protein